MNRYAESLIRQWEGCKLEAYLCSANKPTIGYGHIEGVAMGLTIIQEQADAWLEIDTKDKEDGVLELVNGLDLTEWQIGALISFTYNLGLEALEKSTLLKVIKEDKNNFDDIAVQFIAWNNAGGEEIRGLSKRRIAESNVYVNGELC